MTTTKANYLATTQANSDGPTQTAEFPLPEESLPVGSPQPAESLLQAESPLPSHVEFQDPRIRRTRELLQQALARLLESREFEKISVQEITDAAGVNRATFYAHYPDKFALLECMVAARFHALLADRSVVFDGSCSAALRGIVLGVCDYLAQTLSPSPCAGSDRQRQNQMAPHMESAVVAVVRAMLLDGLRQHPPASGDSPEMLAATASWAIYGAAKEWVRTPNRPSSEEIAATVQRLIAPLLNPAPNPTPASA